jgi:HTH-type transcriptional regulator/antitoxin HigA
MTPDFADLQAFWTPIAPFLSIRNEAEYDAAIKRLNSLVDEVGPNEKHPLYGLLDTLGTLVNNYEQQHHPIPATPGEGVLQFLMAEHQIAATDLPEIGTSQDVERCLAGTQELTMDQIRALSTRFHVSPAAFI